jgi:hypothetical protein
MILITLLASSLGLTLFVVKYQVQDLEGVLVEYNSKITEDREAIHVLKAEWSHLNQPARLRQLAKRYLGMVDVQPTQVGIAKDFFSKPIPSNILPVSEIKPKDLQLVLPLITEKYISEPRQ